MVATSTADPRSAGTPQPVPTGRALYDAAWASISNPWRAQYWSNRTLSGNPAFSNSTPYLNFDWGYGGPGGTLVSVDNFSARYVRTLSLAPGRWRFRLVHDDAARLYVNDALALDQFDYAGPEKSSVVEVIIIGNATTLRVDYAERTGPARLGLYYELISTQP